MAEFVRGNRVKIIFVRRDAITWVEVVRKRRIRFVLARIGMNDFLLITVVVV